MISSEARVGERAYKPHAEGEFTRCRRDPEQSEGEVSLRPVLLDKEYRTTTQGSPHNENNPKIPIYGKSPLLSKPELIQNINKSKIRHPVECAKYAVFHKTEHYYIPLPCKKWSCPHCAPKKKKELEIALSQSEVEKWKHKTHLILTVADDSGKNIMEAFNDLLTNLRRGIKDKNGSLHEKCGLNSNYEFNKFDNLKYVWVKEFQESRFLKFGMWWRHLHVVVNQKITKYDIIPYWNLALKNCFNMVETRPLHHFNRGSYLVKYLTKLEFQELFDTGERRYGASKNVLPKKIKKEPTGLWEFMTLQQAQDIYDACRDDDVIIFFTEKNKKRSVPSGFLPDYNPLCRYGQVR
ncbi:Uncharacterised protein [uncultured archaeon]|nr:Uncharacterised protein [uncultured archaeon]